ncbi:hypothetical protein PanWU01x14_294160 [Parasponia andersonii]|uniref:Uncharacterized protein n=1 Tax=Parasponia andersonii TaxID=3476 RepID=A0A2P5AW73_PARAD|nr:hypothetical protein PanWU01x14_294160 [Parasponia andersonii]
MEFFRGSGYDGPRASYSALPSFLISSWEAHLPSFLSILYLLPLRPGEVLSGFVAPLAPAIWLGQGPPSAVDPQTLVGSLRQSLPFAHSWLRLLADFRGGRYLYALLRLHLLNPGWPRGPSLPSSLLLPGQQAFGPAFALDLVVLPRSSLWRWDVCSWLSFSRVPSDIVWPFIRRERDRETPTLFLTLNEFPQTAPNCWIGSHQRFTCL